MPHKTQRIEPSFHKCLEELNFLKKNMTHRTEPFFHVTHGTEPFFPTWVIEIEPFFFTWLKEVNPSFLNMTQRIELFWILTQRIELFVFRIWRKELNLFSWIWRKDWSFSLKFWHKSKNWTFFSKMTQRIKLSFRIVSQRVHFFWKKWLEEIMFQLTRKSNFWKRLKFFNMTQRIEFFSIWLKELNFLFDSKNWTFFLIVTQNFNFLKMTRRIEPSFLIWLIELNPLCEYDSRRELFFSICLQELNLFSKNFTPRIEFCKKYDTKNWTLSSSFWRNLTQRLDLFETLTMERFFKNMTLRIELFFELWKWNSFTNMAFSKNSTLLNLFIWFSELDLFYMTLRIEPFFCTTQRI